MALIPLLTMVLVVSPESSHVSRDSCLISVVMPVYNTEAYVGAALESLLAQTYSPLEILVVDDGSTDRSPAIIAEYERRDSRIRSLSSARFGKSAALNAGISAATGEYIALLDSDDLALPERFAVQLDWMRRAGVDLCGSRVGRGAFAASACRRADTMGAGDEGAG